MMTAFTDFLDRLPEGGACRVAIRGEGPGKDLAVYDIRADRLATFLTYRLYIGTLCLLERPGHAYFQRRLELTHFPPLSPDEPLLVCLYLRWQGLLWGITSVPRLWLDDAGYPWRGEPMLRDSIRAARLRVVEGWQPAIAEKGGAKLDSMTRPVPEQALFAMGFVEMDLPTRNLLYLENERGHLVYTDPRAALEQEQEDLRLLEEAWQAGKL